MCARRGERAYGWARVRNPERREGGRKGGSEWERSGPAQLPGEKTALVLTQDSLCLTVLPSSLWHSHNWRSFFKLAIFSHMHALLILIWRTVTVRLPLLQRLQQIYASFFFSFFFFGPFMLTVVHNQDQNSGLFYYLLAAVISRCWLTNNWQQTASTDSGISAWNWLELEI